MTHIRMDTTAGGASLLKAHWNSGRRLAVSCRVCVLRRHGRGAVEEATMAQMLDREAAPLLDEIRQVFGLSQSELADLFRVRTRRRHPAVDDLRCHLKMKLHAQASPYDVRLGSGVTLSN